MEVQFIGQNIHFAISLLASLAVFAVFWLIFDAWTERKQKRELLKWVGFLMLAVGFLLSGAVIESTDQPESQLNNILEALSTLLRFAGFIIICAGQIIDPLMARPAYTSEDQVTKNTEKEKVKKSFAAVGGVSIAKSILLPLVSWTVAYLYFRRATTGLERHLKPVSYAFVAFGLYELLNALSYWQVSDNPLVYQLLQTYGFIWWLSQAALLCGGLILGRWVWQYLTKRILSQLFIVLVTSTVVIYFLSTGAFSFLLLKNTRDQALSDLNTSSKVLGYAIKSRQAESAAQAEALAEHAGLADAVKSRSHPQVMAAVGKYAADHELTSLIITDGNGRVLLRAENPDRWGDSISSNTLVQRALIGRSASSTTVSQGVVAPQVSLVSGRPIRDSTENVVGSVVVQRSISNAFVDGIKKDTGLDSTVYGGNRRSATTLVSPDGLRRAVGLKESDPAINHNVLVKGQALTTEASYNNRLYLTGYSPLKDADNNTVGMLLVARPADTLLETASKSIQLAFLITVLLLLLSVYPVYRIAKKISSGIR